MPIIIFCTGFYIILAENMNVPLLFYYFIA